MFDDEKIKKLLDSIATDEEDYTNFLRRFDSIGGPGLKLVKSQLQGRFLNEQRGSSPMDRCNCFLWMCINAFEGDKKHKQENLEFLIGLLLAWYFEEKTSQ